MPVTLDQPQKDFVNQSVRKIIEDIVTIAQILDDYMDDHDNQQNPIPPTGGVLNDGTADNPRSDAPQITAELLEQIRTAVGSVRASITDPIRNGAIASSITSVSDLTARRIR